MDRLPEEVILQILSHLSPPDNLALQAVASRYLTLARDNALWKLTCFTHSRTEALRRRQQLLNAQDSRLAELRNAVTALPGADLTAWDVSQLRGAPQPRAAVDAEAEARVQRARALANWEPGFPGERLDYYEEFIQRHAPIRVGWLDLPKAQVNADRDEVREATGVGALEHAGSGEVRQLVAPLDDGSVCIWDVSRRTTSDAGGRGKLLGQSKPGLLTLRPPDATAESHAIMTETGAVECVSIDSAAQKGYFAVQTLLHEVDLTTLQLTSTKQYPFPITALSESKDKVPLTIGTNWTLHLHDARDPAFSTSNPITSPTHHPELPNAPRYTHATLAQPGPLSLLHQPTTAATPSPSIWVAGRFTSLLHYDRRHFPRLLNTVFSGARIASLTTLPYPLIPPHLSLLRNPSLSISTLLEARKQPGHTLLAAAEYKGKGSLELYSLDTTRPGEPQPQYQNRQTASASKLLSAVPHGGRIVFADGDGNLKWHERDGFSLVRAFNINDALPYNNNPNAAMNTNISNRSRDGTGIWSPSPAQGDIVQKLLPLHPSLPNPSTNTNRPDLNPASNLLLWTSDGRLGLLGFGAQNPLQGSSRTAGEAQEGFSREFLERRAREDAERQYGMAMRRALERDADEVRFVRGLGMGR
ncbi:hypothetical protein B0A50_00871 [Salinomyces thailandicus]|uniref:F-box domain-containing protein n=1 Tax=Salinomyces thailandicus TaxID=706561 RepID=A0A4U0UCX1_9PEZI|nr:hypothetical protein B0A50_00871 [Salinomyces thailandica]